MQLFCKIRIVLLVSVIIVFGVIYLLFDTSKTNSIEIIESNKLSNEIASIDEITSIDKVTSENENYTENIDNLYVYITGEVCKTGVYVVKEGARLCELIEMAGGLTENADQKSINMARFLVDGEHVHVYKLGESYDAEVKGKELININSASKEKLMELPGIGESRAVSIIDYRKKHGGFTKIEDIMNVSGIKQAAFEKMKEYICVN